MFLDEKAHGEPWDSVRLCASCHQPIRPGEPAAELRFVNASEPRLEELNGLYHSHCARPYLSIKHALDMLGRFPFG